MEVKDIIEKLEEDYKDYRGNCFHYHYRKYIEDLLKWIKSNLEKGGNDN